MIYVSHYPLRNNENIVIPYSRTVVSQKSCIPSSISLWNDLSVDMRNINSLNLFKTSARKLIQLSCVPAYFLLGERYLQIIHARLKNHCSILNDDLFNNLLDQNRFCDCSGEVENAEHFFFECQFYTDQRRILLTSTHSFQPLNTQLLLRGSNNISNDENAIIYLAVQRYIKDTKRLKNN